MAALDATRAPLESMAPVAALEAIVQRTGRPPLLIRNDKVELEPLDDFPVGTDLKIRGVEKWIPSVGRVEFVNHSMRWGGTGWVVERKGGAYIVVTNRHVAKFVARRMADGTGAFMRSSAGVRYGANIDFREEADSAADNNDRTVAVTAIDYLADDLAADAALLRVATAPFAITPMQLADKEAKKGDLVALIGYPAFDSRNDANDQARYFRDLYDVKRFAPGKVMQALSGNSTLSHDCTTLGGNSGSPVLSLDSGKVVGLHFSGVYGVENSAVGVGTLKKLLKGVTTSVAVPAAGTEAKADGHHDAALFKDRSGFETKFLDEGRVPTPWPKLPAAVAAALADAVRQAGRAQGNSLHAFRGQIFGGRQDAADDRGQYRRRAGGPHQARRRPMVQRRTHRPQAPAGRRQFRRRRDRSRPYGAARGSELG